MKDAGVLADKYSKITENNISSNFTKFANECFTLVNDYTCDCTRLKCGCGRPSIGFVGLTKTPHHPICKQCLKTYGKPIANIQPKYASAISGGNAKSDDSSLGSRYDSKRAGTLINHKVKRNKYKKGGQL